MTTLTGPPEIRTVAATPRTGARLRLRRAGQDERVVDVLPGKWSIGSSPRCQVILPAGEAQPLQCLVQVDAASATVTRWAAGVLLNGREFSQQPLKDGDCLTIGPWDLVWETSSVRPAPKRTPTPAPPPSRGSRETIDFEPRKPVERPALNETAPFPTPTLRSAPAPIPPVETPRGPSVELPSHKRLTTPRRTTSPAPPKEPVAPVAAEPVAPVESPQQQSIRPAAKTVLVASRKTDAFPDLLGPARPAPSPSPGSKTTLIRAALTRQLFEDRLVVSLWTSNFQARRRARALIAAARDARQRVTELFATLNATQQQLDALRSDRDGEAARAEELDVQLASLRDELARAAQERDRVVAELEALRSAPTKTAPPDPRLQMLTDACGVAKREAAELSKQLATAQSQLADLRQRCQDAENARAAADQLAAKHEAELAAAQQQASDQASALTAAEQRASDQATALAAAQRAIAELQAQSAGVRAEREAWQLEQLEAEQGQAANDEELVTLREQLAAAEAGIEPLRQQAAEADSAREAVAAQLATVQRQQAQWLAECRILQANHAEELANLADERDELRRQLDELASTPAAAIAPFQPVSSAWTVAEEAASQDDDAASVARDAEVDGPTDEPVAWSDRTSSDADATPDEPLRAEAAVADVWAASPEAPANAREFEAAPAPNVADEPVWKAAEAVRPTPAPPAPEPRTPVAEQLSPYSTPSFIDKYRHLLDDDGAEPTPEPARKTNRLLDDEFLSPAQASASHDDDESDEALEAYMSNMMRRVRGDGPAVAPIPIVAAFGAPPAPEIPAAPQNEPEIELDENGMLRLVRKLPMTTNLSALREIANTSARTAIAQHRQRRRVESAASKSLVCVAASSASAYLMLTAPSMQSPWFWGGCVALVAAAGSGAQLAVIFWQRLVDRKRPVGGAASMPYGGGQMVEAASTEPAPSL